MSRNALRAAIITATLLSASALAAASPQTDNLASGFGDPPAAARPRTWWHWVTGNVTKEGITADLEAMKRIGLAGRRCSTSTRDPRGR